MLSKVKSISLIGVEGIIVDIETDIQNGIPNLNMVGLPDVVVKESRERVRSAIKNSGIKFPISKIIINFAPADIKKEGPHLDLAIAIGILISNGDIRNADIRDCIFIGELSLNGEIRSVKGILPMVLEAKNMGFKKIFIPALNKYEICLLNTDIEVYAVSTLKEIIDFYNEDIPITKVDFDFNQNITQDVFDVDFSEVKGQKLAKRAVEVAASGSHNLIMIGPPGGGKTMIAQRIPTILPQLNYEQAIEVTKIYSVAGLTNKYRGIILAPPFRSPHHTLSTASLIGGGSNPIPGEVSLAHDGVLFLDELPEYRRDALEALRQPMEDGIVCISRVKGKYVYPSKFMLIASMNPCPCGYYGYQLKECRCSEIQIRNYLNKVSGPLLDRIDIHISIEPVKFDEINDNTNEESSKDIRKRVEYARAIQMERFKNENILYNSQMKGRQIKKYCKVEKDGLKLLENAYKNLALSTRAYNKILKISRTIADMEGAENISEKHIAEAIQYRVLDRKYW
ncbi:MAG TPA: magnesium chelatase [Clostridiaceae bacterium]|jgi:magnesium chelatase family protein|nr:magnesium chelatase [Clostridiaceae bacterium]HBF76318.1 magnesium chelatase [Clostridiaceae bacterium]HBG39059.1 magnesium chelatase [Clostridiaceae bacterium]HBN27644.1 magnesium chelatase [Clostridiaceae bacterium]HBX49076.1 magnesium chelatase [Clostridiaceae bacterium]